MSRTDWVQAAVLGPLLAVAVIAVLLWLLSSAGLLDHNGWVSRERRRLHPRGRRMPDDFTSAQATAVQARVAATERWFQVDDAVLDTDWEAWAAMPLVPHPVEPPLSDNDHEEV